MGSTQTVMRFTGRRDDNLRFSPAAQPLHPRTPVRHARPLSSGQPPDVDTNPLDHSRRPILASGLRMRSRAEVVRRVRRRVGKPSVRGRLAVHGLPAGVSRSEGDVPLRGVRLCAGPGAHPPREMRAEALEPHVRELEPARRMAPAG